MRFSDFDTSQVTPRQRVAKARRLLYTDEFHRNIAEIAVNRGFSLVQRPYARRPTSLQVAECQQLPSRKSIKRFLVIGDQRNTVCAKICGVRGGLANDNPNRPGMAAMVQPTRITRAPRNRAAQWWVHSPGGRRSALLRRNCFNSARMTAPVQEPSPRRVQLPVLVRSIPPPAINSWISRLSFLNSWLNSWLLHHARSTLDASKCVSTDPGRLGSTARETGKRQKWPAWEMPVRILRLPKYAVAALARKQRGIFIGGSAWR